MSEQMNVPTMVSIKEASDLTHMPYSTIRMMCIRGEIAHVRTGHRYLINLQKLVQYLNGKEE